MLSNPLIRRTLGLLMLATSIMLVPFAHAQNDGRYITLKTVQPSETSGKIEILEFFAYTCPHCKEMEPMVSEWAKTLPEDTVLQRVPVAFNANMADLQKLYYTLENMDRLDLHPAVFKALHDERLPILSGPAIIDWAAEQGLDRQNFTDIFNSFGIQARVTRADTLAKNYQIEGTPSIAVGGRYVTGPGMTHSYQATLDEADKLIEMAREQGQP